MATSYDAASHAGSAQRGFSRRRCASLSVPVTLTLSGPMCYAMPIRLAVQTRVVQAVRRAFGGHDFALWVEDFPERSGAILCVCDETTSAWGHMELKDEDLQAAFWNYMEGHQEHLSANCELQAASKTSKSCFTWPCAEQHVQAFLANLLNSVYFEVSTFGNEWSIRLPNMGHQSEPSSCEQGPAIQLQVSPKSKVKPHCPSDGTGSPLGCQEKCGSGPLPPPKVRQPRLMDTLQQPSLLARLEQTCLMRELRLPTSELDHSTSESTPQHEVASSHLSDEAFSSALYSQSQPCSPVTTRGRRSLGTRSARPNAKFRHPSFSYSVSTKVGSADLELLSSPTPRRPSSASCTLRMHECSKPFVGSLHSPDHIKPPWRPPVNSIHLFGPAPPSPLTSTRRASTSQPTRPNSALSYVHDIPPNFL